MGHDRADRPSRRAGELCRLVLVLVLVAAAACSGSGDGDGDSDDDGDRAADTGTAAGDASALPDGWASYDSDQYGGDANWLCKPGLDDDVCTGEDLDATAVAGDLSTEPAPFEAAADPAVDCFYVYPTVSQDAGLSADLDPAENQEVWVARNQAARLTGACRVFAPVYRQLTTSAIGSGDEAGVDAGWETAYGDVLDAFHEYVANESDGRGFVLVGHSQGAGLLRELIAQEVDPEPALRDRMVAALLLGTTVEVPEGEDVGGTYDNVPVCRADDQVGCVVTYATFAADAPPPADSRFGLADGEGMEAACTNPAALGGGAATLTPYFPTAIPDGALSQANPDTMVRLSRLPTGWVTMPDYVEAECTHTGDASYLAATIGAGPGDERGTEVGGSLGPSWGLHLYDVNLAMGNLVDLVKAQATAYTG